MRFHYDLAGADPILADEPVYDAALLANGELLMLGTSNNNTADGGVSLVTAYSATAANSAVDAVGILQDSTFVSGGTVPDETVDDTTNGVRMGKVILNPHAVYIAEVDQSTGDDVAVESSSTTTTIKETIASANTLDGYWVLFVNCSTSGIGGTLRMITANGTADFTIPALPATPSTSDNYIFVNPAHAYACNLNAEATKLTSDKTLTAPEGATNIRVVRSYCSGDGLPLTMLKSYLEPGQINLGSDAHLFADIVLKDHLYGPQE